MAMDMEFIGNVAFALTTLGVNVLVVFLLTLTQWRKSFVTLAYTLFTVLTAVILDFWAVRVFIPAVDVFIVDYVRAPLYVMLSVSTWTLVAAAITAYRAGEKRRQAKAENAKKPAE